MDEFAAIVSRIDPPKEVDFEKVLAASRDAVMSTPKQNFMEGDALERARSRLKAAVAERNRILGVA